MSINAAVSKYAKSSHAGAIDGEEIQVAAQGALPQMADDKAMQAIETRAYAGWAGRKRMKKCRKDPKIHEKDTLLKGG